VYLVIKNALLAFCTMSMCVPTLCSSQVEEIHELVISQKENPVLYIPIGPSGSGKSTLYKKIRETDPEVSSFSFDTLRHQWYDPENYCIAWQASVDDPNFFPRVKEIFSEHVASKKSVFLDATNLKPATRKFYIEKAKENGYTVVGFVFSVKIEELIARQSTRDDKSVPEDQVILQYESMTPPLKFEGFDVIVNL